MPPEILQTPDPKMIADAVINFTVTVNRGQNVTEFANEALGAYNDLLALTPYTIPCKTHLLMTAANTVHAYMALRERITAEALLKATNIEVSEDNLGSFNPQKAYENEMILFREAQRKFAHVTDPSRRRTFAELLEHWDFALKSKYPEKLQIKV